MVLWAQQRYVFALKHGNWVNPTIFFSDARIKRRFGKNSRMQKITDEIIDAINERIQDMEEPEIEAVWDSFAKEQPAVVGYVLGESRELKVPDAREDVAY